MSVARSVAEVLRDHVVLELEAIDRMYSMSTSRICRPLGPWWDICGSIEASVLPRRRP